MILSGKEIKRQIGLGNIVINPYNPKLVNPNSYNLRLYDVLETYASDPLDASKYNFTVLHTIPEEGLILQPNILYLARTIEYTETYAFVPQLEARSSIARLGISIHQTAGFGDVGFKGCWTLEISCIHPVRIFPQMEICQIVYHAIQGEYEPYKGKYQNNHEVQSSMLWKEY